jgi:hypothetical protein
MCQFNIARRFADCFDIERIRRICRSVCHKNRVIAQRSRRSPRLLTGSPSPFALESPNRLEQRNCHLPVRFHFYVVTNPRPVPPSKGLGLVNRRRRPQRRRSRVRGTLPGRVRAVIRAAALIRLFLSSHPSSPLGRN